MARKTKPTKSADQAISKVDGWANVLTGVGTLGASARDKRSGAAPNPQPLSYSDALALYRSTDTGARIVDIPAEEMIRAGWDLRIPDDHETAEKLGAKLDDLEASAKLLDLSKKVRAFGGAIALVGADDGSTNFALPLAEERIKSVKFLTVFDPSEVSVLEYEGAIGSPDYGDPLFYAIHPRVITASPTSPALLNRVHRSRVLLFRNPPISRLQANANAAFGDSIFDLTWRVIRDFDSAYSNSNALIEDFAQAVFKIKGLAEAIAADRSDVVKERLRIMDLSRSVLRAIALDADGEDFERKPTPISGLAELLDRFANRLAAATRIPVTVLMGTSPAGLNATGASDVRLFYDFISSQQNTIIRKPFERLIRLVMLAADSPTRGKEPENWALEFRPLWQPSEQEQATTRQTMANSDQIYLGAGVLSADEVRQARFGGDRYSVNTSIEAEDLNEEADDLAESEGVTRGVDENGEPIQVKPGEMNPAAGASGAPKAQDTALNGAQVTSAIEIVKSVHRGELPRESGLAMLAEFFNLSPESAEKIMGPENFKPEPTAEEKALAAAAKNPPPQPGAPKPQPRPQPTGIPPGPKE